MTESHEAVSIAEEIILNSQDSTEYEIKIQAEHWANITPGFLKVNKEKGDIFRYLPEGYHEQLYQQLATKLTNASQDQEANGFVTLKLCYRELDALFLSSIYRDPDYDGDPKFRESMFSGLMDKSIAFYAKGVKGSLLHVAEVFVAAGGQDRFGHLETLRRVEPMRITTYIDDDGYCEYVEDKEWDR